MCAPGQRRLQRPPRPQAHPSPPPTRPSPHHTNSAPPTPRGQQTLRHHRGPARHRAPDKSVRPNGRHNDMHHNPTRPQGAVPSPTNTGAVGSRPKQPPETAHLHREPTPSPTESPQPQTPPGASAHGHQPAASQAAATQAHREPRPRHGIPDRPTAGPAYAPPEDPPMQAHAGTPTDTATTRPSDNVRPHAHDPTKGLYPLAPATSSTAAPGDLPATTHAEPASQQHHAPPAGPRYRPQNCHLPVARPRRLDPGPDLARTTVPADAPQSAGPGSGPGPPPVSEGHAREAAQPADDEAALPAPPTEPQHREATVGAEEMRGPPQRTATPTPVGEPSGGADLLAIQHADQPNMAAHGSGEASTAG